MVAANIANLEQGTYYGNQHVATANLRDAPSQSEAAEKLNVSERSVNTAKAVKKAPAG